jgi:predicted ATPase/DNA-binding SARP family transcriptional activator/predicted negative regulator of RcsB-dependent stress response
MEVVLIHKRSLFISAMAEKLELALLGNPEVRLAGHPLGKFRSAKSYAILYYLVVTRRTQPRTVLTGLFWGDIDEYYARRNFNRTLSDLVRFVEDYLVIERQSVAFARSQPYWLDVEVLENAATTQPTAQTVAALAAAANLYRGEFLEGFYVQDAPEFEQWVLAERTRLRAHVLQLLHTLADYYAQQGSLAQAMAYDRRILQLEPWSEEAHRQLMLLLAQSGQRSAALAQYELCRQALRSELDIEPDATTLELVARIREGKIDKVTDGAANRSTELAEVSTDPAEQGFAASVGNPLNPSGAKVTGKQPTTQSPSRPAFSEADAFPAQAATPAPTHNLPGQRTPFIGRSVELADIMRLLVEEDDCRLLTLIGPGGMGKTRLALKAAEQMLALPAAQQCFGDGIFFIPLENVNDENGLITAVISALTIESNFPSYQEAPLSEQLFHFLHAKTMLLVLDNFEHLVEVATLLSDLLLAAPKVKLLVTARESLGLQEAWFYPVLGLTIPSGVRERKNAQDEYDAVRLFAQCARRAQPGFVLESERSAVLRICTLVEGMPLGLELAAAWLKVMTCTQVAEEVARGLDILTARYQNIPPRHRSMRVVMEHSWRLLTTAERAAIEHLAIFRGQFRQEAAETITGTKLMILATLVEKALARLTPAGHYQLHELVRQYAEEQLNPTTQTALRNAHATYYADLLHQQKRHLFTAAFRQVWTTVGVELDNIRYAWLWLIEAAGSGRNDLPLPSLFCQLADVLAQYHIFHSLWLPGQALFDHACQVLTTAGWQQNSDAPAGQPSRRAALLKLQIYAAQFQLEMGRYRTSLALAEQALVDGRAMGIENDLAYVLMVYSRTQVRRGAYAEAIPALEEALALGKRLAAPEYQVEALINLGVIANSEGRYTDAHGYYRQALAFAHKVGYRPWVERILTNIGTIYFRQQAYGEAHTAYEQAIQMAQEEGDQTFVMINTSNIGGLQRVSGQHHAAIQSYQRSLGMARSLGMDRWVAANLNAMAITYLEMQELSEAEGPLREALTVGQQSDSTPDMLGSVGLLGHLLARRGQVEAAIKALLYVEQHPATMARDKAYNQPLLAELRSELPAVLFAQTESWVTEQTLADVVRWLLHHHS